MKNALLGTVALGILSAMAGIATAADLVTEEPRPVVRESDGHGGVRIGYLACRIGEGGGYLLGSAKELDCDFRSTMRGDRTDHYIGTVKKLGIDLGYTTEGRMVWAVLAPTAGYHHGSLDGHYVGASAEATLGVGVGTNVLLGGTGGSIQLQPVSLSGQIGVNVAAAGTTVTLQSVE